MSNAASAIQDAEFRGACLVADQGPSGMITIRGDLDAKAMTSALTKLAGVSVPQANSFVAGSTADAAWMSPDELMLFVPYEKANATAAELSKALAKEHALVANVSDARAMIKVQGDSMREVLAKLTPADMSETGCPVGTFRRSRLAQVAAAFWLVDDETAYVICFRSVARYVFDILSDAAAADGHIGYFKG